MTHVVGVANDSPPVIPEAASRSIDRSIAAEHAASSPETDRAMTSTTSRMTAVSSGVSAEGVNDTLQTRTGAEE